MRKFTRKDINMAVSWARGELSTTDVFDKVGSNSSSYLFLARALKMYVLQRDDEERTYLGDEDQRVEDR